VQTRDRDSRTAGHVAALRGLGVLLPQAGRLIDDPYGAAWSGWGRLRRFALKMPVLAAALSRPLWRWLLYMQVRTFALDREIERFAGAGGRQLVLLGAGLDARALRLSHLGLKMFEVDHPATQLRKRRVAGDAATFVPFDFERDPLEELPGRLATLGWRTGEAGCVVFEGVTMYLSEDANAKTFAMLKDLLAPGSVIAFTYFTAALVTAPGLGPRMLRRFLTNAGEPWLFGWDPNALPVWLAARGFALERAVSTVEVAGAVLPGGLARRLREDQRRIARARRCGGP
jgi:methyltransferase (TIGR00027 family)